MKSEADLRSDNSVNDVSSLIKISKDFATLLTTINPIATLALFAGLTASLTGQSGIGRRCVLAFTPLSSSWSP